MSASREVRIPSVQELLDLKARLLRAASLLMQSLERRDHQSEIIASLHRADIVAKEAEKVLKLPPIIGNYINGELGFLREIIDRVLPEPGTFRAPRFIPQQLIFWPKPALNPSAAAASPSALAASLPPVCVPSALEVGPNYLRPRPVPPLLSSLLREHRPEVTITQYGAPPPPARAAPEGEKRGGTRTKSSSSSARVPRPPSLAATGGGIIGFAGGETTRGGEPEKAPTRTASNDTSPEVIICTSAASDLSSGTPGTPDSSNIIHDLSGERPREEGRESADNSTTQDDRKAANPAVCVAGNDAERLTVCKDDQEAAAAENAAAIAGRDVAERADDASSRKSDAESVSNPLPIVPAIKRRSVLITTQACRPTQGEKATLDAEPDQGVEGTTPAASNNEARASPSPSCQGSALGATKAEAARGRAVSRRPRGPRSLDGEETTRSIAARVAERANKAKRSSLNENALRVAAEETGPKKVSETNLANKRGRGSKATRSLRPVARRWTGRGRGTAKRGRVTKDRGDGLGRITITESWSVNPEEYKRGEVLPSPSPDIVIEYDEPMSEPEQGQDNGDGREGGRAEEGEGDSSIDIEEHPLELSLAESPPPGTQEA